MRAVALDLGKIAPTDCIRCLVLSSARRRATFCIEWRLVGLNIRDFTHEHMCLMHASDLVEQARAAEAVVRSIITSIDWRELAIEFRQRMQNAVAELS